MIVDDQAIFSSVSDPQLRICLNYIATNFEEEISIKDLAIASKMSPWAVSRRFQNNLNTSPSRWIWMFRTNLSREFIKIAPTWQLTDIATLCGFASLAHFSRLFRTHFNETPSRFRNKIMRYNNALDRNSRDSFKTIYESTSTAHQLLLDQTLVSSVDACKHLNIRLEK